MELITPEFGLIFWTGISFLVLLFILRKFAWKPILNSVNTREQSIKDALASAEAAKRERISSDLSFKIREFLPFRPSLIPC